MNRKKAIIAAAASLGALSLTLAALPSASADPEGTPTYRELAGVGSDTTMDVMNALSNAVTIGGVKVIGSYNADPSTTEKFKTKDRPECEFTRAYANGSGNGIKALDASVKAGDNCIQFARSSNALRSSDPAGLTFIPFATDAVTVAVRSDGSVAKSWSLAEVQAIYKCEVKSVVPVLPQTGSGTRGFWLGRLGITEQQITDKVYPCLLPKSAGGEGVPYTQEHDGRQLKANEMQPYSIAVWQAQSSGAVADRRGLAVLGVLDGKAPTLLNGASTMTRPVFNVVPTARITGANANSTEAQVFAGKDSLVCKQEAVIAEQGFGPRDNCGDTSSRS